MERIKAAAGYVKRAWLLLLALGALILIIALSIAGFRFAPGIGLTRAGYLLADKLPAGAVLYIDEQRRVDPEDGQASASVLPGVHRVIIGTPLYQPWNELVSVSPGVEARLDPLFVPIDIDRSVVAPGERSEAWQRVTSATLPTLDAPLALAGGCALVSVSGSRILATPTTTPSCAPPPYLCLDGSCEPTIVLPGVESVRSLFPYPGRDDALIVALGSSLFVLELDPREPQFFAPLMRSTGGPLRSAPWSEDAVLVTDGSDVMLVPLDITADEENR